MLQFHRDGLSLGEALTKAELTRPCCRTHVLAVPDVAFALKMQPCGDRFVFDDRVEVREALQVKRVVPMC